MRSQNRCYGATAGASDELQPTTAPRRIHRAIRARHIELMLTWTRRLPRSTSGTSPLAIRCASHSTIAVLPTPGSPQNGIVLAGFALAYGAFVHGLRAPSGSWPSAPSR
jgi:hypothetical protein